MIAFEARAQLLPGTPLDPDDPETTHQPVLVVAPDIPVPRNGLLLFWTGHFETFEGFERAPAVQVGRTVGGSIRTFGGSLRKVTDRYWAWKAAEPLEPGEYLVSIAHGDTGSAVSANITIVDDVVLEPPLADR